MQPVLNDTPFQDGEAAVLFDRRAKKHLVLLEAGKRVQVAGGAFDCDDLIGKAPGARIRTHRGGGVAAYRATLEDYVLLMPRAAAVMPPKDIAYVLQWADIFPGARVVEAGIGSGGLTIGLLEAAGPNGQVISFDLREDHANRALKNIAGWRGNVIERLDFRLGDVNAGMLELDPVDRIVLDHPEPWTALAGVEHCLKHGGIWVSYLPTIRQVDQLVLALLDAKSFAPPDVIEILQRKWVADRQRLRPELTMVGHSGFLVRARRRGEFHPDSGSLDRSDSKDPNDTHPDLPIPKAEEKTDEEPG
ncbi:MAG: tRNA (adenine-N1)-methyltransferase [Myxococcota bacterium]